LDISFWRVLALLALCDARTCGLVRHRQLYRRLYCSEPTYEPPGAQTAGCEARPGL